MGLFKSKKVEPEKIWPEVWGPEKLMPKWQYEALKKIYKTVETPAFGILRRISEPTKYQREALRRLERFLTLGVPFTERPIYALGREEIARTLRGEYSPLESPYWQAYKEAVRKTLEEETLPEIRRAYSLRGGLYSSAALEAERKAIEEAQRRLEEFLGRAWEAERLRRLEVAPRAVELARMEALAPLETEEAAIRAALQYGVPIERVRERPWEILSRLLEYRFPYALVRPELVYPSYRPSPFERVVVPLAKTALSAYLMGNLLSPAVTATTATGLGSSSLGLLGMSEPEFYSYWYRYGG